MTYTLVEIDDLSHRTAPAVTDKMLIKTAGGIDQYAVVSDVLGIVANRDSQSFSGTTAVLALTSFTYDPGGDDIDVGFNGSTLGSSDYAKTDATTVTLAFTPIASDVVTVRKRWEPS